MVKKDSAGAAGIQPAILTGTSTLHCIVIVFRWVVVCQWCAPLSESSISWLGMPAIFSRTRSSITIQYSRFKKSPFPL